MRSLVILCCVLVFSALAYAQNSTSETTKIIADQDKGTITFIIDGEAVAQINRDGLHVVESINYGGVLTDTGSAYAQKVIAQGGEEQAGGHD